MNVIAHLLAANGPIPNHPRWPLLVYPGVVQLARPEAFEELFTRNRWPAAWRNGVHPFHHYHSNSHEVLGVYEGEVTVQFGGERGISVTARPGDVIVLPAGTGHKKLASRGALGIVGARSLEQLQPSLDSVNVTLSAEERAAISALSRTPPPATDRLEEQKTARA